jgi:Reverse transcriptase (RNA-dependent DNA polymerase)
MTGDGESVLKITLFTLRSTINGSDRLLVVTSFIYPAVPSPATDMQFSDQFAFRPSGSTAAALVSMLHKITHHLVTKSFVIVLALDFSKAFDTVRYSTLIEKLAQLNIPDHVYSWLADFFTSHSHCVKYQLCLKLRPALL